MIPELPDLQDRLERLRRPSANGSGAPRRDGEDLDWFLLRSFPDCGVSPELFVELVPVFVESIRNGISFDVELLYVRCLELGSRLGAEGLETVAEAGLRRAFDGGFDAADSLASIRFALRVIPGETFLPRLLEDDDLEELRFRMTVDFVLDERDLGEYLAVSYLRDGDPEIGDRLAPYPVRESDREILEGFLDRDACRTRIERGLGTLDGSGGARGPAVAPGRARDRAGIGDALSRLVEELLQEVAGGGSLFGAEHLDDVGSAELAPDRFPGGLLLGVLRGLSDLVDRLVHLGLLERFGGLDRDRHLPRGLLGGRLLLAALVDAADGRLGGRLGLAALSLSSTTHAISSSRSPPPFGRSAGNLDLGASLNPLRRIWNRLLGRSESPLSDFRADVERLVDADDAQGLARLLDRHRDLGRELIREYEGSIEGARTADERQLVARRITALVVVFAEALGDREPMEWFRRPGEVPEVDVATARLEAAKGLLVEGRIEDARVAARRGLEGSGRPRREGGARLPQLAARRARGGPR